MKLKSMTFDIEAKILVANSSQSPNFLVFEKTIVHRKFAAFQPVPFDLEVPPKEPEGHVEFVMRERCHRLQAWAEKNFNLAKRLGPNLIYTDEDQIKIIFLFAKDGSTLVIHGRQEKEGAVVSIATESMEIAGDVLQSMAQFFGLKEVESEAIFPQESEKLKELLERIEESD